MSKQIEEKNGIRVLGCVGVDSGQLLLTDPSYIDNYWDVEEFGSKDLGKDHFNYSSLGCSNQTIKNNGGEVFGLNRNDLSNVSLGTVFSTGYGDGCYPVYGKTNDEGRIMGVFIDFGLNGDCEFLEIEEVEEMLS